MHNNSMNLKTYVQSLSQPNQHALQYITNESSYIKYAAWRGLKLLSGVHQSPMYVITSATALPSGGNLGSMPQTKTFDFVDRRSRGSNYRLQFLAATIVVVIWFLTSTSEFYNHFLQPIHLSIHPSFTALSLHGAGGGVCWSVSQLT